jgi:tRNA1(Val) A37 N6-methylase TrmN6
MVHRVRRVAEWAEVSAGRESGCFSHFQVEPTADAAPHRLLKEASAAGTWASLVPQFRKIQRHFPDFEELQALAPLRAVPLGLPG